MTRAKTFRRALALLLCLVMVIGTMPVMAAGNFSDTDGHWAESAIGRWTDNGILKGENGLFRPDDYITRAELAAILVRVIGYTQMSSAAFADVSAEDWFYGDVSRLYAAGIMLGDGDGVMRPNDYITREEAAVLIARAFGIAPSAGGSDFPDGASISDWAVGYVAAMKAAGYVNGDLEGNFNSGNSITRAEVVTILNNMVTIFKNAAGEISGDAADDAGDNTVISAAGVTVKDFTTPGAIYIMEGVGSGTTTFENVNAGVVYVRGGDVLNVTGKGSLENVVADTAGTINVGKDSSIGELVLNEKNSVTGAGEVDKAVVNAGADGSSFETQPKEIVLDAGASVIVGDVTYTNTTDESKTIKKGEKLPDGVTSSEEKEDKPSGGGAVIGGGGLPSMVFNEIVVENDGGMGVITLYSSQNYGLIGSTTVLKGDISVPVDLRLHSNGFVGVYKYIIYAPAFVDDGGTTTYTLTLKRSGYQDYTLSFAYPIVGQPTNLEWVLSGGVNTGKIMWNSVPDAVKYKVTLKSFDGTVLAVQNEYETTNTEYDLLAEMKSLDRYVFSVSVRAVFGIVAGDSATVTYTAPFLTSPTITTATTTDVEFTVTNDDNAETDKYIVNIYKGGVKTGKTATIDAVSGQTSYGVALGTAITDLGSGTYRVTVKAVTKAGSIYWTSPESTSSANITVSGAGSIVVSADVIPDASAVLTVVGVGNEYADGDKAYLQAVAESDYEFGAWEYPNGTFAYDEVLELTVADADIAVKLHMLANGFKCNTAYADISNITTNVGADASSGVRVTPISDDAVHFSVDDQLVEWVMFKIGNTYVAFEKNLSNGWVEMASTLYPVAVPSDSPTSNKVIANLSSGCINYDVPNTEDGFKQVQFFFGIDNTPSFVDHSRAGIKYYYTVQPGQPEIGKTFTYAQVSDWNQFSTALLSDAANDPHRPVPYTVELMNDISFPTGAAKVFGFSGESSFSERELTIIGNNYTVDFALLFPNDGTNAAQNITIKELIVSIGNTDEAKAGLAVTNYAAVMMPNGVKNITLEDSYIKIYPLWQGLDGDPDSYGVFVAQGVDGLIWLEGCTIENDNNYNGSYGMWTSNILNTGLYDNGIYGYNALGIGAVNDNFEKLESDNGTNIAGFQFVDNIFESRAPDARDVLILDMAASAFTQTSGNLFDYDTWFSADAKALFDALLGTKNSDLFYIHILNASADAGEHNDAKLYYSTPNTYGWTSDYYVTNGINHLGGSSNITGALVNNVSEIDFDTTESQSIWPTATWGTQLAANASSMSPTYVISGSNINATGTLNYVELLSSDSAAAWPTEQQKGFYALFSLEIPADAQYSTGTIVEFGSLQLSYDDITDWRDGLKVLEMWVFLGANETTAKAKTISIKTDWDGTGTRYAQAAYTLNFAGVTFDPII